MKAIEFKQHRRNRSTNCVNTMSIMSNNYQYTKETKIKNQNYQQVKKINTIFSIHSQRNVKTMNKELTVKKNKDKTNNEENIKLIIHDNNTPLKSFYNS